MILNLKRIFFILIGSLGFYLFYLEYNKLIDYNNNFQNIPIKENEKIYIKKEYKINEFEKKVLEPKSYNKLKKTEVIISKGDTFLSILKKQNFNESKIFEIINEINNFYDLRKLKVNNKIFFYKDIQNKIKKIELYLDIDSLLIINLDEYITIKTKELEKFTSEASNEFKILYSLYADGLDNNIPQDILIKLIKLFSFDLDFQRDIKKDTLVSVSYEMNQIEDSNIIEYKDINYALISINGKKLEYFKFLTDDGYIDYFNRDGKNVKKSILKTPLDGARLSSSFGMRKHPISGYNKMHKGVDFAAPKGTPIYAGGNGVIEYLGNNGGYGKYIRIRHNNEYKTAYAHLSGFKKGISKGIRVNQGDIIGFVGSTGNSTGPHLHYEIIFQGKQINPLKLKLPSGKILEGEELKRFQKEYKKIYANHLNLLFE